MTNKRQTLNEYLNNVSPDANIRLLDIDGELVMKTSCGEILESMYSLFWMVKDHYYESGVLTIYVY